MTGTTTVVGLDQVQEIESALEFGRAVVFPNPSPLTYVVAATSPRAVNAAKQRPVTQEVAVWVRADEVWSEIAGHTRLPVRVQDLAADLLRNELVTVLLPVHDSGTLPPWLAPAVRDGHVLLFGTVWAPLKPALSAFPRLYVSSANLTGCPPASTANEAVEMFPDDCLIVDGDAERDPRDAHRATSMVRVGLDGTLELMRSGATDDVVTKREIREI